MRRGYCLQGPIRVESSVLQKAPGKTVASRGAIWNSQSHCKMESHVADVWVPFLLTPCGEACLGRARLDCSWGCAPGQALTHVLTTGVMSSSPRPLMLPGVHLSCLCNYWYVISAGVIPLWAFLTIVFILMSKHQKQLFVRKEIRAQEW